MAYLEILNLGKSFNGTNVLHDINICMNRGEVLTLIGPSGEGKTTFLRCLNFLETPDCGIIRLDGKSLFDADDPVLSKKSSAIRPFGMVFQAFHLFPQYTVLENVMLAPSLVKKEPKAELKVRCMGLLEKVGLREKADSYPNTLSGGQQQRAAIARALAMEPEILCFDEPTSALDPALTQEVLHVIRMLKQDGRTMIIITHEMAFAQGASDIVAFLSGGTILEKGTPEQLFLNPKTEELKLFLRFGA